jgi:hypothetical protein
MFNVCTRTPLRVEHAGGDEDPAIDCVERALHTSAPHSCQ